MILSDNELQKLVDAGCLPESVKIGPSSIDLCLSRSFSRPVPTGEQISLGEDVPHHSFESEQLVLAPQEFILASTEEFIKVPSHLAAYVEGRSSIGRLGLQVQNAGFIDSGFHGRITLELANQAPFGIELKAGLRICQIVFLKMTSAASQVYSGKYQGQFLATSSRLSQDEEFSEQG